METHNPEKQFSIRSATERKPFADGPTRTFFTKWCEVNDDSIAPKYVTREEYRKQKAILRQGSGQDGILQKDPENPKRSTLFVPDDLKLWEMVRVIEAVDKDTFAHNPGKRRDKRKELHELGESFVNAGIYVAKNRDDIGQGKDIAEQIAKDLYRYGNALRTGHYDEQTEIGEIAANSLSPKQTEEMDTWFGVDKLARYKKQDPTQTRGEMLSQFFKVTEEAESSEPHRKALEKVQGKYFEKPINKPQQGLQDAIFLRGLEEMTSEMGKDGWRDAVKENFKEIGIDLEGQRKNLMEVLDIPKLKQELADIHETGDVAKIGDKEREVAGKIQEAVSKVPYARDADGEPLDRGAFPSNIVENQSILCVGATMLGGALLKEAGINYLVAGKTQHSLTLLVTTDEKVYIQDFLNTQRPELTDALLLPIRKGEKPLTIKDIIDYSHTNDGDGLTFFLNASMGKEKGPIFFNLSHPGIGDQAQVVGNLGYTLYRAKRYDEAIDLFERSIVLNKNNSEMHVNISDSYLKLKENEKALKAADDAIALNPRSKEAYTIRTMVLNKLGRTGEAAEMFKNLVKEDESEWVYDSLIVLLQATGKNDEMAEYLQRATELYPDNKNNHKMLGSTLLKLKRSEEAVGFLTQADQEDPSVKLGLGHALKDLGRKDDAIEAYNEAIALSGSQGANDMIVKLAERGIKALTEA